MDKIHLMLKEGVWYAGRVPFPPKGNRTTAPKMVGRGIPEMIGWAKRQKQAIDRMLPVANPEIVPQLVKEHIGQPRRRKEGQMYIIDKAIEKVTIVIRYKPLSGTITHGGPIIEGKVEESQEAWWIHYSKPDKGEELLVRVSYESGDTKMDFVPGLELAKSGRMQSNTPNLSQMPRGKDDSSTFEPKKKIDFPAKVDKWPEFPPTKPDHIK